jgi:toxin ParE1/3/4
MTIGVSARARLDLEEIEAFISRDDPWRAETFVAELVACFEAISERPRSFPVLRPELPDYRAARRGRYLILFSLFDNTPRVERVLHGARDIDAIMREPQ